MEICSAAFRQILLFHQSSNPSNLRSSGNFRRSQDGCEINGTVQELPRNTAETRSVPQLAVKAQKSRFFHWLAHQITPSAFL